MTLNEAKVRVYQELIETLEADLDDPGAWLNNAFDNDGPGEVPLLRKAAKSAIGIMGEIVESLI